MAEPPSNHGQLKAPELDQLDQHLEEAFDMPTSRWWESVEQTFVQLQELVNTRASALLADDELDEHGGEHVASARAARAASLPSIVLLPAGNYALGLTATSEPLQCVAFGTVGPKLYVELLWETVAQVQEAGVVKIMVHSVLQGPVPKIILRVEAHIFELSYLQCESLVRAYPSIIDAQSSFLEDRDNCTAIVQEAVNKLQRAQEVQKRFKEHPDYRRAYYYKREWAIAWGYFNSNKATDHIFELCDDASIESDGDFSSIVSKFVDQWNLHYPLSPKYRPNDWNQLLSEIEAEPLHRKLDYPYYLQVTVLYTGSSNLKGGEWLEMVERKLEWLKDSLDARIPLSQSPGTAQQIRIWPQRLVHGHSDPEDGIYEGCFVLGLDIQESALSTARESAERWKLGIKDDDLTLKDQCFIDVIISHGKTEIEKQDLKPCTRTWPRPSIKAEERSRGSQSLKLSKREKREMAKDQKDHGVPETPVEASKPTKKLRPASDVLSRLRHGDYSIDEFVVGYKDRHSSRLMEKPAVQWAKDTTDEEFIPEHRIEYFKRYSGGKEEVLWDKTSRLDRIFQHGGSG